MGVLFDYQDWQVCVVDFDDVVKQFVYYNWRNVCGWFIQYQNFGLGYQSLFYGYLLMLIVRQFFGCLIVFVVQDREEFIDLFYGFRDVIGVNECVYFEVFFNGYRGENIVGLRYKFYVFYNLCLWVE